MNYVYAVSVADVQLGKMKAIVVEGKEILLVNAGGQFFAMQRFCPHAGADLCAGKIADSKVLCPKHDAAFDLDTGEAVDKAKVLFLKFPTNRAETYRVKVENDSVFIEV
ncbi:MAG: Rieske (2Fe-2S) protein [Cyanobacteria bacterium CRU_2_1]|nr:Rieske (2Fe-2S) protein [Cyanobacteria bacterium CRU_2_1]